MKTPNSDEEFEELWENLNKSRSHKRYWFSPKQLDELKKCQKQNNKNNGK